MRRIFGFGETVLDIIFKDNKPMAAKPGGSVLNAFVSLGRLGWNPFFISEYARDNVGNLVESNLRDNGVNTDFVNRFTDGKSALAIAFLDQENNASYSFYKDFPEERLQVLPQDLGPGDIVLFGSIYASSREVRASVLRFLNQAREKGSLIVYDPNFRKAHLNELTELRPRIIENLEYADIIRGSDEDFRLVFGLEGTEDISRELGLGSRLLLYTMNRGGVEVSCRKKHFSVPARTITPVSTIGAGDNFNAGILHFILENGLDAGSLGGLEKEKLEAMAATGIEFASHVCMSYENYISREFAEEIRQQGPSH